MELPYPPELLRRFWPVPRSSYRARWGTPARLLIRQAGGMSLAGDFQSGSGSASADTFFDTYLEDTPSLSFAPKDSLSRMASLKDSFLHADR